jgi:hypothetical protein
MAYRTGRTHFINFRVPSTGGGFVTGLTLGNFTTLMFVDNASHTETLTLTEIATGLYSCSYVPSIAGYYYLELYDAANTFRVADGIEIDTLETFFGSSDTIALTQNYESTNKFKVTVANPQTYQLYIYNSSDWTAGNTGINFVVNSTAITTSGNWVAPTINVVHGTYHIIIKNITNTIVLAAFLVV